MLNGLKYSIEENEFIIRSGQEFLELWNEFERRVGPVQVSEEQRETHNPRYYLKSIISWLTDSTKRYEAILAGERSVVDVSDKWKEPEFPEIDITVPLDEFRGREQLTSLVPNLQEAYEAAVNEAKSRINQIDGIVSGCGDIFGELSCRLSTILNMDEKIWLPLQEAYENKVSGKEKEIREQRGTLTLGQLYVICHRIPEEAERVRILNGILIEKRKSKENCKDPSEKESLSLEISENLMEKAIMVMNYSIACVDAHDFLLGTLESLEATDSISLFETNSRRIERYFTEAIGKLEQSITGLRGLIS
jgi:plasmid maintenance system antidote protein VapI